MSMNYIGKFFSNFKEFYNEINTATLTGAIDVIVVEQPDGSFNCSPFHVRFGKLGVLRSREKIVDIEINGEPVDIHMKLGESGEAFFVEELEDDENEIPEHLATSPIPVSEFENIFTSQGRRRSFDLRQETTNLENEVNDYTKRRNTGDIENISRTKNRERDFIKRQIGLGNIGIGENSTEDVTLAIQGNKPNFDENDTNETIFQMDSLDDKPDKVVSTNTNNKTNNKVEETINSNESRSSKKKRRKTKKKNASRKSSNNQMATNITELSTIPITEQPEQQQHQQQQNDSTATATDPSSIESNSSETELKEIQINDGKPAETLSSSSSTRKIIDPDFHFFSDTELTTNNLNDQRTNATIEIESVQSDSEFEMKNRKGNHENTSQSWEWGGFPTNSSTITTTPLTTITTTVTDEMLQMKNQQQEEQQLLQQPPQDKSMISNMFSFMKKSHQNDGIYLSDLHSMDPEVAALYFSKINNKNQDADMDYESGNGTSLAQSPNSAEGCKSIDSDFEEHIKGSRSFVSDISISLCGWDIEPDIQRFNEHQVTFSDFCNNPALLDNPNLVVSIHGKYYNWKVAGPIISSFMIFNRPLLQSSIDQLCNMYMPPKQQQKQQESRSWWSWRRSKTASREQTPSVDLPKSTKDDIDGKEVTSIEIPEEQLNEIEKINDEKDYNVTSSSSSSDKYKKTLRLSSKQIALLNLRNGMNEVAFSVTTAYQGTTRCTCHLYKWKWDDKIVISDIDGTITKSDVLGHILPIMGKDWAQSGVAQLFNKIADNGYKLLYLSARAIGQARITRDYLKSIKQGDLTMPDGPILLNPTSLITAFHREVIEKKPEQFKISCMSDIKALFPPDSEPFYAGYGNRINDVWAYRAVGIPIMRIFTINPKGELKHELTQTFQSTYTNMTDYVDQLFPAVIEQSNDYSQFTYWRDPLPVVDELSELP